MAGTRRSGRTTASTAPKYVEIESESSYDEAPKRNVKKTTRRKRAREEEDEDEDEGDAKDDAYVWNVSCVSSDYC